MAAWLIRGASTCWAQPCSKATRPFLVPCAGNTLPPAAPRGGRLPGASASMALRRRNKVGVAGATPDVDEIAAAGLNKQHVEQFEALGFERRKVVRPS